MAHQHEALTATTELHNVRSLLLPGNTTSLFHITIKLQSSGITQYHTIKQIIALLTHEKKTNLNASKIRKQAKFIPHR